MKIMMDQGRKGTKMTTTKGHDTERTTTVITMGPDEDTTTEIPTMLVPDAVMLRMVATVVHE